MGSGPGALVGRGWGGQSGLVGFPHCVHLEHEEGPGTGSSYPGAVLQMEGTTLSSPTLTTVIITAHQHSPSPRHSTHSGSRGPIVPFTQILELGTVLIYVHFQMRMLGLSEMDQAAPKR